MLKPETWVVRFAPVVQFAFVSMICLAGPPLSAQSLSRAGISQPLQSLQSTADTTIGADYRRFRNLRIQGGFVGEWTGFLAGGALAYVVAGDCGGSDGCYWHPLPEMVLGAAIGSLVGTAAVAARQRGAGNCTYARRLRRSLVGATAGAVGGVAVLAAAGSTGSPVVIIGTALVAILAPPAGAAIALKPC